MIINKDQYIKAKKAKEVKEDQLISYSVFSSFFILSIQYFVLINFSLLGTTIGARLQLVFKMIIFLFFLRSLPIVLKRRGKTVILTYLIAGFAYMWNFLFFSQNIVYLNDYFVNLLMICIPSFLYVYSLKDISVFKSIMIKSSYIVFITSGSLGIMVFLGNASIGMYSMTLSYYLLLPAIVFYNEYFNRNNIFNLLLSLVTFFLIIALGARGPLLSLFSFMVLKFIYNNKKKKYLYYISRLLIISGVFFVGIFFKDIIQRVYDVLLILGIDSRTLYLLLQKNIHMSGREVIYSTLFHHIKLNPILGYGLTGDIFLLEGYGFAHNFFLEIIINFGVIIGSVIICLIFFLFYKALRSKIYLNVELAIIFFSLGWVHLFVSSSYLVDFKFWIFIGLILNMYRRSNSKEAIS